MRLVVVIFNLLILSFAFQCSSLQERLKQKAPNSIYLLHSKKKENWDREKIILPFFRLWSGNQCQTISDIEGSYSCDRELVSIFESLSKEKILNKEDNEIFRISETLNFQTIQELNQPIKLFVESSFLSAYSGMEKIPSKDKLWEIVKLRMDDVLKNRRDSIKKSLTNIIASNGRSRDDETKFIKNFHPYLIDDEIKDIAFKFINFFEPSNIECRLQFREPSGESFVSSGYEDPVEIQISCPETSLPIDAVVTGNSAVRLSSNGSIETQIHTYTNQRFDIDIYSLSMNANENVLAVKAIYLQKDIREILKKELNLTFERSISLVPTTIQLSNIPTGFSPEYSRYMNDNIRYSDIETVGSLQNGQFQSTMMSNGGFSFGGVRDNKAFDLIFGHPNGQYAEGIWSSFSKVKIGEDVYSLREMESQTVEVSDSKLEVLHKIEKENVWIYSFLEKDKDHRNGLLVGYRIENRSNQKKAIGVLLFLDTWAGSTDGVPFSLGAQSTEERMITTEFKFNPTVSSFWETNDSAYSGQVFLQNKMVGVGLVPPDEVSFVNWGSGFGMDWDYAVSGERTVTGDSAVYLKWNPKEILPNKPYTVKTLFSSIDRTKEVEFTLTDPLIGNGLVTIFKEYPFDTEIKIQITSNSGTVITSNGTNLTSFKTGKDSQKQLVQIPVVVSGGGKMQIKVTEIIANTRKEYPFELSMPESDRISQPTLFQPQKKIPVQFYSKEPNRKIIAKLIDASSSKVLDTKELVEKKEGTSSIYSGELQPPSNYQGQGVIQYVDVGKQEIAPIRPATQETTLLANQVEITMQNGSKKLGTLLRQNVDEITVESEGKQETFQKRNLSRIRFGR